MNLGFSRNYAWCTSSVLGRGATASVFQGVNTSTGEHVAVKTFHQNIQMYLINQQNREFEALKKVNHKNIVKLLGFEDNLEAQGKVIVMELCTGGSLSDILHDPRNSCGLPEKEFLLVLEHLSAGMKHLRDIKIAHRDLKPGNIMKFISEDGQTIYKLADFGTARELEDNQPFMSFCGTEEYLHPDLYERAILRRSTNQSVTANVDLWSIGVTLFHVATGHLPFRPFGGRRNRETMLEIIAKKPSGMISGIQFSENGPIEWSASLPTHCHLSDGLKTLVTPLLAGLLEENREKTWSFDRFFQEVTVILRKRVVHVFYINRTSSVEVFLEPDEQIDNFRERIFLQTEVPLEKQILLFDNEHLEKKVTPLSIAKEFPQTTNDNPIFLLSKDDNNAQLLQQHALADFPSFDANVSIEADMNLAKDICIVGYEYKRRVEVLTSVDILMNSAVTQYIKTLETTITLLHKKVQNTDNLVSTAIQFAKLNQDSAQTSKRHKDVSSLFDVLVNLKNKLDEVAKIVDQMFQIYVTNKQLHVEWTTLMNNKSAPCITRSCAQSNFLVQRLRESYQQFRRDAIKNALNSNDHQFHALEKIKIGVNCKRLRALLCDDVQPAVLQTVECFSDWWKLVQTINLKIQFLENDIADCQNKFDDTRNAIAKRKIQQKADAQAKYENANNYLTKLGKENICLPKLDDQNDTKIIIEETNRLINNFKEMGILLEPNECDK